MVDEGGTRGEVVGVVAEGLRLYCCSWSVDSVGLRFCRVVGGVVRGLEDEEDEEGRGRTEGRRGEREEVDEEGV